MDEVTTLPGYQAAERLKEVIVITPLQFNRHASTKYDAHVALKREDLQVVRSYKIRGAYNKMVQLNTSEKSQGVVCASAGNHAQGVAFSCAYLNIKGTIFMPAPTPQQKIDQVRMFGQQWVDVQLVGDTFDDAFEAAMHYCENNHATFIHPFNDLEIIAGQSTVGLEILNQTQDPIDYLFLPVGGGGLASGVAEMVKNSSPYTKIIGVEPSGAPSMTAAFQEGKAVTLPHIDKFVDGAAVKAVGDLTYEKCRAFLDEIITVDEGEICTTILNTYNKDAIVLEPAGALSLAALEQYADVIKGKNVVCILSGSNNDITRMEEIKERSLLHEGLKHYFVVKFPQRSGALKDFVNNVLGPNDDITFFEYTKKNSREKGTAVVGIELKHPEELAPLKQRMKDLQFFGDYLNPNKQLMELLT